METILLFIIILIVSLLLIWVTWQLQGLRSQLNTYNDYVGEVREEVVTQVMSQEFLNQLRNHAQLQLTNTVQVTSQEMQRALQSTYRRMLQDIEKEAAQILNGELEQYRQTIKQADTAAANVTAETERQLASIKKTVEAESQSAVREEKQKLLRQLDDKLSDIVAQYLLEALGEHVDLGSQKDYIFRQLEENKEMIKKDINDEF